MFSLYTSQVVTRLLTKIISPVPVMFMSREFTNNRISKIKSSKNDLQSGVSPNILSKQKFYVIVNFSVENQNVEIKWNPQSQCTRS